MHIPTLTQTLIHPLNSSSSKHQYSFSKSNRFHNDKPIEYKYYVLPSTNQKKASSFGLDKKGIFNGKKDGPGMTRYNPVRDTEFQYYAKKQGKGTKGFSFANGRQETANQSFIKQNDNPSPGLYNPKAQTSSHISFSIPRNKRFQQKKPSSSLSQYKIPAPNHYMLKSSLTHKILSTDRNHNPCLKLNPTKTQSRKLVTQQPERKLYNPEIMSNGELLGLNRGKGFSMGKSQRTKIVKNQFVPGPGKYGLFSEFIMTAK